MCVLCFGVVVCCAVSLCVVLWCWCWCAMCGALCAWCVCVVCCVCGVLCCVWCVWRGLARGKKPVCRFKTSPCVGSNTSVCTGKTRACPFSLSLPSFSFSSLFPPLVVSLFSLSNNDNDLTRPVGLSLCTHGSDLPECQSACTLANSLFGRTCSQHARNNCLGVSCASLVPLGMKWAVLCWKWVMCLCLSVLLCLCLFVFGCVVSMCFSMC